MVEKSPYVRAGVNVRFKNDSSWLKDSNYSVEEQGVIYDRVLQDIYNNPGWYLERFQQMREFRVSWGNYKRPSITKPYKFVSFGEKGGNSRRKAKAL